MRQSTLLSLVADLETPTSGEVSTGGRRVSLMFQESALFPWLTAARNVELPLRANGVSRAERQDRVAELLDLVHLGVFADKRPHRCPAACGSGSRWPGRWPRTPRSC